VSRLSDCATWLLDHGADANALFTVWGCKATPLHFAVELDRWDLVDLLLSSGADLMIEDDKFHSSAVGWARHFGNDKLADHMESHPGMS